MPDLFKTRGGFQLGASLISDENYASPLLILIFAKYLWRELPFWLDRIYKKSIMTFIIKQIAEWGRN